jgi:hypothetical protein
MSKEEMVMVRTVKQMHAEDPPAGSEGGAQSGSLCKS